MRYLIIFFLIIFSSTISQEKFALEASKELIKIDDKIKIHCDKFDNCYYLSDQELIKNNNERLEYLGDAVINLAISDYLIKNFTDLDEGSLSILRSNLVSRATLSKVASQLGLENYLKIGKSILNQENKKISIYCTSLCNNFCFHKLVYTVMGF